MKTPDEIKKALEHCAGANPCMECPFDGRDFPYCIMRMNKDALALVQRLENDASFYKSIAALNDRTIDEQNGLIQQLQAERDAAVNELVGTCQVCRWEETAKCASCHFCEDAWNVHESNWQWRGVQKEG